MAKKYYFASLPVNYFDSREQKSMVRRLGKGGQLDYLRLVLAAIPNGGYIVFQHSEETIAEEIGYDILEIEPQEVERILQVAEKVGLLEWQDDGGIFLKDCPILTRSEGDSAERMRKHRASKRDRANSNFAHSDGDVSQSDDNRDRVITTIDSDSDREKEKKKPSAIPSGVVLTEDEKRYCRWSGESEEEALEMKAEGWISFSLSEGAERELLKKGFTTLGEPGSDAMKCLCQYEQLHKTETEVSQGQEGEGTDSWMDGDSDEWGDWV